MLSKKIKAVEEALGELSPVSSNSIDTHIINFKDISVGEHEILIYSDMTLLCPLLLECGCYDKKPGLNDMVFSFIGSRFEPLDPMDDFEMDDWTQVGNFVIRKTETVCDYLLNA